MPFSDELRNQINAQINAQMAIDDLKAEIEKRVEKIYDYYMAEAIQDITKKIKTEARNVASRMTSFDKKEINGTFDFSFSMNQVIPFKDYDTEGKAIQEILIKNKIKEVRNANTTGVIMNIPYPTIQLEKSRYSLLDLNYINKYEARFSGYSKRFFEILETRLQLDGISMGKIYCLLHNVLPFHSSLNIEFFTYHLPTSFTCEEGSNKGKKHVPSRMYFDYSIKL